MEKVNEIIDFLKVETSKSQILTIALIDFAESLKSQYDKNYFKINKIEKLVMPDLTGIKIIDENLKQEGINDGDALITKTVTDKFYPKFYSNNEAPENKRVYFGNTGYIITKETKKVLLYLLKTSEKVGISLAELVDMFDAKLNITMVECQETMTNTDGLKLEHQGFKGVNEIIVKHYFTLMLKKHGEFLSFSHNQIFTKLGEGYEVKEGRFKGFHTTSSVKKHFLQFPIAFKQLEAEGVLDILEDDKFN